MKAKDFDFRVWDNEKGEYNNEREVLLSSNGVIYRINTITGELQELEYAPLEIELFTGFTDIEGNKIYEGDIVDDVIKGKPRGEPAEIVFKGGCFYRKSLKYGIDHIFTAEALKGFADFKIISNIHENKDLLKANEKETTSKE